MAGLEFNKAFDPAHGTAIRHGDIADVPVWRITAPNPGPFTFHGTNTWLVGEQDLTLIDPGPDDPAHEAAIMAACAGRPIARIVATHTHVDHTPLAVRMARRLNVPLLGCAPHHAARDLALGEINALDASADRDYRPDTVLADGDGVETSAGTLRAVATPGHTANHLCFALEGTGLLFSGDHVMAWATSIVAPPDGSMRDYMASLDRLLAREDQLYLPGHGGLVREPMKFVRGLRTHRRMRERAVMARLEAGDRTITAIVKAIYADVDPRLHSAAGLSVFAHLEDLVQAGRVCTSDGRAPRLDGHYLPV